VNRWRIVEVRDMRDAETTLTIIGDKFTGEPDTRKRCKSGSEGGGWKRDTAR
jgi:hypothetical protein